MSWESEQIDDLITAVQDINTTLGNINTTLGNIDTTLGNINTGVGNINTELGNINTELGKIEGHSDDISSHLDTIQERASNENEGLFMTSSLNYVGSKSWLHQAAFDVAMAETGKIDLIKEKINDPINWEE